MRKLLFSSVLTLLLVFMPTPLLLAQNQVATGNLTSTNTTVTLTRTSTPPMGSFSVSVTGTFNQSMIVELSNGNGVYTTTQVAPVGTGTAQSNITATGLYSVLNTLAITSIRVRQSAFVSGTAVVTIVGSTASSGGGGGGSGGGGGAITAAVGAISDGADVAEGTRADDRCQSTDTTPCTLVSLIKQTNYLLNNPVCDSYIFDRSSTGDVQLVAASGSTIIYICGYSITGESVTTSDVNLRYATASDCTTGATNITPPVTIGTDPAGAMIAGKVVSPSGWNGLKSPSTRNLCVHRSAAVTSEVEVWYGQR